MGQALKWWWGQILSSKWHTISCQGQKVMHHSPPPPQMAHHQLSGPEGYASLPTSTTNGTPSVVRARRLCITPHLHHKWHTISCQGQKVMHHSPPPPQMAHHQLSGPEGYASLPTSTTNGTPSVVRARRLCITPHLHHKWHTISCQGQKVMHHSPPPPQMAHHQLSGPEGYASLPTSTTNGTPSSLERLTTSPAYRWSYTCIPSCRNTVAWSPWDGGEASRDQTSLAHLVSGTCKYASH